MAVHRLTPRDIVDGVDVSVLVVTIETVEVAVSAIGVAAFVSDSDGSRTLELESSPRVRGASVVKPLLAWAAAGLGPFAEDPATWDALARPAITASDNQATAALWSRAGGERLLAALNQRVGVGWQTDGDGEHPSLRVMVTAAELASAYAALASDGSHLGLQLRKWLRKVPTAQTFGVRRVACDTLGVDETSVGVKCGWFGGERAHAVLLVDLQDRTVGAAVTTSLLLDATARAAVRDAIGDDFKLVAAHDALAGETVRSAIPRALLAARQL